MREMEIYIRFKKDTDFLARYPHQVYWHYPTLDVKECLGEWDTKFICPRARKYQFDGYRVYFENREDAQSFYDYLVQVTEIGRVKRALFA